LNYHKSESQAAEAADVVAKFAHTVPTSLKCAAEISDLSRQIAFSLSLMDRIDENPWFHADNSVTCIQLTPARKHFDEVSKRLDLSA
jgi:hypothetical protein